VIVLAAAVSDYGVENPVDGKIRSNDMLTIKLKQLPKIIYYIKEWCPKAKVVGFKLLVNSKERDLIDAAKRSINENNCDLIVANDLRDIKENNHKIHLVYNAFMGPFVVDTFVSDPKDPNFLARTVAEYTVKL
jgi:phosphopantothenoylcysteine synthetase/decarboxylase